LDPGAGFAGGARPGSGRFRIEVISPSTHFTAMGVAILEAEMDDPVCTDPAGTDRKAVHERIIGLVAEHFGLRKLTTKLP
jgi:hypothetical protein